MTDPEAASWGVRNDQDAPRSDERRIPRREIEAKARFGLEGLILMSWTTPTEGVSLSVVRNHERPPSVVRNIPRSVTPATM
jgi:hypothetical protein